MSDVPLSPLQASAAAATGSSTLPGRLAANFCALISARFALATIEIEEARMLALRRAGWLVAAGMSALLALQFSALVVLLSYSGTERLWIALGLAVVFLFLTFIAITAGSRLARERKPLLETTLKELAADFDSIGARDARR